MTMICLSASMKEHKTALALKDGDHETNVSEDYLEGLCDAFINA